MPGTTSTRASAAEGVASRKLWRLATTHSKAAAVTSVTPSRRLGQRPAAAIKNAPTRGMAMASIGLR